MNGIDCVSDLEENEERSGAIAILNTLQERIEEKLAEFNELDANDSFSREFEYKAKGLQEALDLIQELR